MFDTYKSIKDLKKEGRFTEQQAASIVKVVAGSTEQGTAGLASKQDIERIETSIRILKADLSTKIAEMHASILKWVFGMFIAFGGAIVTAMYYAIKYMPIIQQAVHTN